MSTLYRTLLVLMTLRLLMPPGICACKWNAPAARLLLAVVQTEKDVPDPVPEDPNDHEPGCPASPFAVGMGVRPPAEPLPLPALSLDLVPSAELTATTPHPSAGDPGPFARSPEDPAPPDDPLYLTLRTLLL